MIDRSSLTGMRVFLYRNLNRSRGGVEPVFSIQARENRCVDGVDVRYGNVIAYVTTITLRDCSFIVRPAGRRLVLSSGRKNVHAGIYGTVHDEHLLLDEGFSLRYNPFLAPTFVDEADEPFLVADYAFVGSCRDDDGVWRSQIRAV